MPVIGVISDTHNLLRAEALAALRGAQHIIHAGDIGSQRILDQLASIAPVTAVRGNNDQGDWAAVLPLCEVLVMGKQRIVVLHDIAELGDHAKAIGCSIVITGHSHKPAIVERDGVLFLNPGSAGPRRFRLPVTLATLDISDGKARATLHSLID